MKVSDLITYIMKIMWRDFTKIRASTSLQRYKKRLKVTAIEKSRSEIYFLFTVVEFTIQNFLLLAEIVC